MVGFLFVSYVHPNALTTNYQPDQFQVGDENSIHLVVPQPLADSVADGSTPELAADFDSRPEAISNSRNLIGRERDRLGD